MILIVITYRANKYNIIKKSIFAPDKRIYEIQNWLGTQFRI